MCLKGPMEFSRGWCFMCGRLLDSEVGKRDRAQAEVGLLALALAVERMRAAVGLSPDGAVARASRSGSRQVTYEAPRSLRPAHGYQR